MPPVTSQTEGVHESLTFVAPWEAWVCTHAVKVDGSISTEALKGDSGVWGCAGAPCHLGSPRTPGETQNNKQKKKFAGPLASLGLSH